MIKIQFKPYDLFRAKENRGEDLSKKLIKDSEALLYNAACSYARILAGYSDSIEKSRMEDPVLSRKALKLNLSIESQDLQKKLASVLNSFSRYSKTPIYSRINSLNEWLEKRLADIAKKAYNYRYKSSNQALADLRAVADKFAKYFDKNTALGLGKGLIAEYAA